MNLYLDDNSCKGLLAILLRKAGHTVVVPSDVGRAGCSDPRHFMHALQTKFVMLTRDHEEFLELHDLVQITGGCHPGVLAIRLDNDASRDMKDRDIVRAIGKLERAGVPLPRIDEPNDITEYFTRLYHTGDLDKGRHLFFARTLPPTATGRRAPRLRRKELRRCSS